MPLRRLRPFSSADRRHGVNDQPLNHEPAQWVRFAPGKPVLKGVNWGGLRTLYIKEVRRFFKVQLQTVWAPAITTLLYLAIFTIALGRSGRTVMGVPFADFIAPGLIVMAMMQNAFANASFSLLVGKIQGNIVDYLMPPLSTGELMAGLIGAAVTRAFLVGCAVWVAMLIWPGVSVDVRHPGLVFWFGLMGALLLSFLGLLTSVWAEKFDHAAAVTNFVVTPLSLLSGTFYSVEQLAPTFRTISHLNPFFYVISGFRAGFLGISDSPLLIGAIGLLVVNMLLWALCFALLRAGWKIKN
jgi:ABC-2 type transport system permease protein